MELEGCVRCARPLKTPATIHQTGDPAVAIYLSGVTVGIRPRIRTHYQRGLFCARCSISVPYGPPPEGEFNLKIYRMLAEMQQLDKDGHINECARVLFLNPSAQRALMPGSKQDATLAHPVMQVEPIAS
jgi:hypothetical protein